MFNKVLVFGGVALSAILIVENIVISSGNTYIFIWYGRAGMLSIISIIIGILIGYGLKGFKVDKNYQKDNDLDF